jgi:hypothetical protein
MMNLNLRVVFALTFSLILSSCGNNESIKPNSEQIGGLKIQKLDSDAAPTISVSASPIKINDEDLEPPPDLPPDNSSIFKAQHQPLEKEESAYNNYSLPEVSVEAYGIRGIVPGKVQLVFKDGLQVKIKKADDKKLFIEDDGLSTTKEFKEILAAYKVLNGYDLAQGRSQAELDELDRRAKAHYKGHLPQKSAIQNYTFPKDTDLVSLVKRLRKLSSIHSANLELELVPAYTKYQISQISNNGSSVSTGSSPSDPGFAPPPPLGSGVPEATNWWWLTRHKFFLAWYQFTTTMPTIAIIDSGFDTDPGATDRPNYTGAMRIVFCSAVGVSNCADVTPGDAAVQEPSGNDVSTFSHGTTVASIAGAPKDNGDNLAGAAPGAPIMPIRVMIPNGVAGCVSAFGCLTEENIATAIRYAAAQPSVDVINLSISALGECPMSAFSNVIRSEIQDAITAGKVVVAAVGNNLKSLQVHPSPDPSDTACGLQNHPTGGEIIVGGVENDTSISPHRTKGWNTGFGPGPNNGSSYDRVEYYSGTQAGAYITISAASKDILVPLYNPNGGVLRSTGIRGGTSLATPMVAAVAGMMKKAGQAASVPVTYTPVEIKSLLYGTADISRYTVGSTNNTAEDKFLVYRCLNN